LSSRQSQVIAEVRKRYLPREKLQDLERQARVRVWRKIIWCGPCGIREEIKKELMIGVHNDILIRMLSNVEAIAIYGIVFSKHRKNP